MTLYEQIKNKLNLKNRRDNCKDTKINFQSFLSSGVAILLLISCGFCFAWTSPVIPHLRSHKREENPLGTPITTLEVSFIAGALPVALFSSHAPMAKICQIIGRKRLMFYSGLSTIICFSLTAFAKNIYVYYVCLVTLGFSCSGIMISVPIYNCEIAETSNRGIIGCSVGLCITGGILLANICSYFLNFKMLNLVCALPALIHVLFNQKCIIESPIYLLSKGRKAEALTNLENLRQNKPYEDIEAEYLDMQKATEKCFENKKLSTLEFLKMRSVIKPFFISLTLCLSQQFCGLPIIIGFVAPIFNDAGVNISGNSVGILVVLVNFIIYVAAACVVEKVGRRPLLLFSSMGCSVFMFGVGICFYLKHIKSPLINNISWLPVLFVIIFVIFYGLGLGLLPPVCVGELLSHEVRAIGLALVLFIEGFTNFLNQFSFPLLSETFGTHSCMIFYSICSLIAFVVIFLTLPETKGKSFNEIQNLLNKK